MITFNVPTYVGSEIEYINQAVVSKKICGDGIFTKKCNAWIEEKTGASKAMLTTSCTHALEMAALLCEIEPDDEVILPSYTFSSTANAFVLAGAKLVFIDIRPDTMNMDEKKIEEAITSKTKAIVVMHYAGVACEMDTIMAIASKYNLKVVEDAAQAMMSTYKGQALGTIGDFGCYSYHETKNYIMGEGGALLLRDKNYFEKAEILREKGTDRSKFNRGQIDKYSWEDYGSSYLPSDINAAHLWAQLLVAEEINNDRLSSWNQYYNALKPLADSGKIELPVIPEGCIHNAHMFWIKTKDLDERTNLIEYLKMKGISSVFHYVPLHSAKAGIKFGRFHGEDKYTTSESNRLTRLPMYYGLKENDICEVTKAIADFYQGEASQPIHNVFQKKVQILEVAL